MLLALPASVMRMACRATAPQARATQAATRLRGLGLSVSARHARGERELAKGAGRTRASPLSQGTDLRCQGRLRFGNVILGETRNGGDAVKLTPDYPVVTILQSRAANRESDPARNALRQHY